MAQKFVGQLSFDRVRNMQNKAQSHVRCEFLNRPQSEGAVACSYAF